jgi:hypothetical protein
MADPVSWLLIRPGWRVEAVDGSEAGRVEEVTGDSNADIFDGLAIEVRRLGARRYVASEQVAEITDHTVRLALDEAGIAQLPAYKEPAEAIEISPEGASWWTRTKAWLTGR